MQDFLRGIAPSTLSWAAATHNRIPHVVAWRSSTRDPVTFRNFFDATNFARRGILEYHNLKGIRQGQAGFSHTNCMRTRRIRDRLAKFQKLQQSTGSKYPSKEGLGAKYCP